MPISFGLVLPGNGFIQLRLDHFLERTAFLISAKSSSSDSVQSGFLHRGSLWGNTEKRHKPYLSSRLFSMGELILPAMNERGFLQSFHLFTPVGKGTSMETYKTTSRRALALIQIWASEPIVPLSHVRRSLSHGSRPYPGVVGNDVPTERAAWVFPSWGEYSTNVLNKQEGRNARVRFIFLHRPLLEPQGWREGVGERVCARNSQHQDDELVAPRGPPSVRWKQEQV